jgi:uncharacterized protein (DUF885 family)
MDFIMRVSSLPILVVAVLVTASPAAPTAAAPPVPAARRAPSPTAAADKAFIAIYSAEWAWRQAEFGRDEEDQRVGPPDHLSSVTPATQQRRLDRWTGTLKQLDALNSKALSPEQHINFMIYRTQIENLAASIQFKDYEAPLNSDSAFWSNLAMGARKPFRTAEDYRRYLRQLDDMPRYFSEQIANMKAGLARGFTPPKITLTGRDDSVAQATAAPETNPFYIPFKDMPTSIAASDQAELRKQGAEAVRRSVIPAHQQLLTFLRQTYMPGARETLAAEALPDGKAYYRQQIREYTTLDMDPDAIHAMGLSEVARIHAQMLETMKKTGFTGDFAAFLTYLRTDPKFYAKTPQELLDHAAWIAKRFDGKASQYFGLLPRGRFGIEPVPANIAPYYTAGRGGAGTYFLNTYDLPSRPLYNLTALTLHESAPGHSFQLNLAAEHTSQPAFRREGYISAYGEGWALYAEKLGVEMGLYETPYDDFGRLSYEMWRACRLVVDTGIHHKGWTRDQAIAFLADNTALPRHEIETEVDRYISWPGQALSYKLGELDILRLRKKAETALGPKFDLRAFHDAVLSTGSVPLPVLDARIDRFIAAGGEKVGE